jgi:hypothetical protein
MLSIGVSINLIDKKAFGTYIVRLATKERLRFKVASIPIIEDKLLRPISKIVPKLDELARLHKAVGHSEEIILKVKAIFPLDLFPDTIIMDRQKLTVVNRTFFNSAHTVSVQLKNIRNVESELGPLYGSVTITSKQFANNTYTIKHLRRSDIVNLQRSVQGAMVAHEEKIDTSKIHAGQLRGLLHKLGS